MNLQEDNAASDETAILVVHNAGQTVGLGVSAFGEGMEVILKPLEGMLARIPGSPGTALPGDGQVPAGSGFERVDRMTIRPDDAVIFLEGDCGLEDAEVLLQDIQAGATLIDSGDDKMVCVILAAQAAALRDRIDTGETIDLVWRTVDVLTKMASLAPELSRHNPGADMERQCAAAIANMTNISQSLADMAFQQSQQQDFTRQMADCIAIALTRLAASRVAGQAPFSPGDLEKLYVCAEQREIHQIAIRG